jgi:hypothetical protein
MKRIELKKPKVFRTLIRCIRMDDKPLSHTSERAAKKRMKSSKNGLPSFSAGKTAFWTKTL